MDKLYIIEDYIENLYNKLNKPIKITIKSIGGQPIYITVPENSSIKQLKKIFINKYPKYKSIEFFLISSYGDIHNEIIEQNNILKLRNKETFFLISKPKKR